MKKNRRVNAFTLIELLTVIAIIGVLVALLFPAVKAALLKAEVAKAQTAIAGLSTAFRAYYTEYGKWPVSTAEPFTLTADNTMVQLLKGNGTLTAVSTAPYQGNPRNIVFLEFKAADLDGSGSFVDPWKRSYFFTLDTSYDNQIQDPFDATKTLSTGFAVWSSGPDGAYDAGGDLPPSPLNKDNVKSW